MRENWWKCTIMLTVWLSDVLRSNLSRHEGATIWHSTCLNNSAFWNESRLRNVVKDRLWYHQWRARLTTVDRAKQKNMFISNWRRRKPNKSNIPLKFSWLVHRSPTPTNKKRLHIRIHFENNFNKFALRAVACLMEMSNRKNGDDDSSVSLNKVGSNTQWPPVTWKSDVWVWPECNFMHSN